MKRVLFWLIAACAANGFAGPVAALAQDRLVPPPGGDPVRADVTLSIDSTDAAAVKAVAHVAFKDFYVVTGQAPVSRDGSGRFLLDATVELGPVIMIFPPPPLPEVDLTFELGTLENGRYEVLFRMNGAVFAKKSFVIGDESDPEPPPPEVSLAFVDAQRGADGSWVAEVGVTARPEAAARLEWLPVESGAGSFTAALKLHPDPVPVPPGDEGEPAGDAVFQTDSSGYSRAGDGALRAPRELIRHTYSLGSPLPGVYPFRVMLGEVEIGTRRILITESEPPEPVARLVALEVSAAPGGAREVTARLLLSNPLHTVLEWGTPVPDGTGRFVVDVRIGDAPVDPDRQPLLHRDFPIRLHNHTWNLGNLEPGAYEFAVLANGAAVGSRAFVVRESPPLPPGTRLAFIHVKHGSATSAAEVGILPARGMTVTSWGDVARDEDNPNHFHVTIEAGPPTDPADEFHAPPRLERHVYSLGELSPGRYAVTVHLASPEEILGMRRFQVAPRPSDPPSPLPIVTHIRIQAQETAVPQWIADVGLLFLRPGRAVKDWGDVTREDDTLTADIVTGPADPAVPPPDGEKPDGENLRADGELGGWPVRPVRHQYALGALDAGKYRFVITIDGRKAASESFEVPGSGLSAPTAEFQADSVTTAGNAPHPFTIIFTSGAGWPESPSKAAVTIDGPDGFTAVARLVSAIPSTDPLGRIEVANYEVDPPDGSWGSEDSGRYFVSVDTTAVVDGNGNTLPESNVGRFGVRILPPPLPGLRAGVSTSMADGIWRAEVSFPNSGGWSDVAWGDVRLRGPVFSARASITTSQGDGPVPAEFRHTYEIGALAPGYYLFVFTSDGPHAGVAEISVPGIEPPTPLLAWLHNTGRDATLPPDDDSDGDRWPCFAEFYTGGDPRHADPPAVEPAVLTRDGTTFAGLRFRRVAGGDPSIRCRVELASDFNQWTDGAGQVEWLIDPPDLDGTQQVTVIQKAPVGSGTARPFMRLVLAADRQD